MWGSSSRRFPNHWYLSQVEAQYWKPILVTRIPISSLIQIYPNTNMLTQILIRVRTFFSQNTTGDCDEHLCGQVSTSTGRYQLLIFHCTNVHPWRYAQHNLGMPYFDDVMSYKLNNTGDSDEHLFRQASTHAGHYQLSIFHCTNVTLAKNVQNIRTLNKCSDGFGQMIDWIIGLSEM